MKLIIYGFWFQDIRHFVARIRKRRIAKWWIGAKRSRFRPKYRSAKKPKKSRCVFAPNAIDGSVALREWRIWKVHPLRLSSKESIGSIFANVRQLYRFRLSLSMIRPISTISPMSSWKYVSVAICVYQGGANVGAFV